MKRLFVSLMIGALLLSGCVKVADSSQARDARNTEEQQSIYQQRQPVPRFEWSQTRDTLIQLYKLQNEARSTFSTFHSNGTGAVIFACPSRGYAIPADTQLTNPVQLASQYTQTVKDGTWHLVEGVIEQPEPNGVYSSKNTDGTWVLCVRDRGEVTPVYTELKVQTFPFEVSWDQAQQMLVDTKKPSSASIQVRTAAPSASPTTEVIR